MSIGHWGQVLLLLLSFVFGVVLDSLLQLEIYPIKHNLQNKWPLLHSNMYGFLHTSLQLCTNFNVWKKKKTKVNAPNRNDIDKHETNTQTVSKCTASSALYRQITVAANLHDRMWCSWCQTWNIYGELHINIIFAGREITLSPPEIMIFVTLFNFFCFVEKWPAPFE